MVCPITQGDHNKERLSQALTDELYTLVMLRSIMTSFSFYFQATYSGLKAFCLSLSFYRTQYVNCVRFFFSVVCDFFLHSFFVCESNISGTAERICAKFTRKTCLVPRSDEFECQGQRSNTKVTRDKKALYIPSHPSAARSAVQCIVNGAACVRFVW